MKDNFTIDDFLGGKIKLKQSEKGYRATSDSVLLSSAISPKAGQTVLDVGAGTGIVSLCLAYRAPDAIITGLEIQPESFALAKENSLLNHKEANINFILCDIANPTKEIKDKAFDFVITNPPYATEKPQSPTKNKAIANHESTTANLETWLDFCIKRLKPKGTLALIHKADRLDDIIALLQRRLGKITIYPLYPKKGKPASRIIITAVKNSRTRISLMPGLILHQADGAPTREAEQILRLGHTLESVI